MYGSKTVTTTYRGARETLVTTYTEIVKCKSEQDVLAEFLKLMEHVKHPGLFNPELKIVTDRNTGAIDRVVKSWSESAIA